ncbi:hypothetical protein VULLAG_LOCUS18470 [Vulpes lagopus]
MGSPDCAGDGKVCRRGIQGSSSLGPLGLLRPGLSLTQAAVSAQSPSLRPSCFPCPPRPAPRAPLWETIQIAVRPDPLLQDGRSQKLLGRAWRVFCGPRFAAPPPALPWKKGCLPVPARVGSTSLGPLLLWGLVVSAWLHLLPLAAFANREPGTGGRGVQRGAVAEPCGIWSGHRPCCPCWPRLRPLPSASRAASSRLHPRGPRCGSASLPSSVGPPSKELLPSNRPELGQDPTRAI